MKCDGKPRDHLRDLTPRDDVDSTSQSQSQQQQCSFYYFLVGEQDDTYYNGEMGDGLGWSR